MRVPTPPRAPMHVPPPTHSLADRAYELQRQAQALQQREEVQMADKAVQADGEGGAPAFSEWGGALERERMCRLWARQCNVFGPPPTLTAWEPLRQQHGSC